MKEQLEVLKQKLLANPRVCLVNFNVFPPITDAAVDDVRKLSSIPEDVLSFYRYTNGLQLRWYYTDGNFKDLERLEFNQPFDWMWPVEHYWQMDGIINILPLEMSFLKNWKDFIWFDFEQEYDIQYNAETVNLLDFKKQIKPVDLYDKYFSVAFYSGDSRLPLLFGEDHNVEFLSYEPAAFGDYISFILDNLGAVKARESFFKKKI
jgi:hypothetical protein